MKPARSSRRDLQRRRRRAGGGEHGQRIGFGVERIDFTVALLPVPADAGGLRQRAPDAGGGGELVGRRVAAEYLTDLEQADVGKAPVGVSLRRGNEAGNEARPHVGQFRRDRIGQYKFRLAAAEQLGLLMRDERPGDRFDQIARRQRPLGLARARLDRREHRLARRLAAIERRQRHTIDADDAHHFLDHVGLALHVRPPRRHRDFNPLALAGDKEAEPFEHAAHLRLAGRQGPQAA